MNVSHTCVLACVCMYVMSLCVCRVAELEVEVKHGADKMVQLLKENEAK